MVIVTVICLLLAHDRAVMKPRRELNNKYRALVGHSLWEIHPRNLDSTWLEAIGRQLPTNFAEPAFGTVRYVEINDDWTDKEIEYILSVISSPSIITVKKSNCDSRVPRYANSRLREIKVIDDGDIAFALELAQAAGSSLEKMRFIGSNLGVREAAYFTRLNGKERLGIEFDACNFADGFSDSFGELSSISNLKIMSGEFSNQETKRRGRGASELVACLSKFSEVEHFEFIEMKDSNGLQLLSSMRLPRIKELRLDTNLASFTNDGIFPNLERATFYSHFSKKDVLNTIGLAKSPNLRVIEFRGQKISPELMSPLANLERLNRLCFFQCELKRDSFKPLQQLKEISWCFVDPDITAQDMEKDIQLFNDIRGLERLTLSCFMCSPSKKVNLFANLDLPNLKKLTIEGFDTSLDGIEKFPSLSSLRFLCGTFKQQSINALAQSSSLKKLSVEVQFMNSQEVAALTQLKKMESIELYCKYPPADFHAIVKQIPNVIIMTDRRPYGSHRVIAFDDEPQDE